MAKKKNNFNTKTFAVSKGDSVHNEALGISNLDGRLWEEIGFDVGRYFSDLALVRTRVAVESRYLVFLSRYKVIRKLTQREEKALLSVHEKVDLKAYKRLRKIESVARHDVISMTKLMNILLIEVKSLKDILEAGWIHWGLASEDVDNISRAILIKEFLSQIYFPKAASLLTSIGALANKTKEVVIPGKTHLQTAIPTTLGKEVALFGDRLSEKLLEIKRRKIRAKLTGATGNLSAHKFSFPEVNWRAFSKEFVESFGLEANLFTTQVEPKNNLVNLFSDLITINSILVDLSQDMRLYIGFGWLAQLADTKEFGSSAMPQKVNPIDFENTHGNALMANWILEGLVRQLPVSWLQRDLSDKTIQRNLGLPFGYSLISLVSAEKGVKRVSPNDKRIKRDLGDDWGLMAEGVQTYLRAKGLGSAYDKAKEFFRGKQINRQEYLTWVKSLGLSEKDRDKLVTLTPADYTGYAKENAKEIIKSVNKSVKTITNK